MEDMEYKGWDEWSKKFKPIQNKFYPKDPEAKMFDNAGKELEFVKNYDPQYVWTNLQGNMSVVVCAGYQTKNVIGYYITEVPWSHKDDCALISVEVECKCYKENGYEDGELGNADCPDCEGWGMITKFF